MAKVKKVKKKKADPANGEPSKPGKLAGLLGGVIGPLTLGASAFAIVYFVPSKDAPVQQAVEESDSHAEESYVVEGPLDLEYVVLDEITISARGDNRVLRIGLTLEVPYGYRGEIDPSDPRLRDAFMGYLRAIEVSQLDEASFLAQLRAQLLRRAQLVVGHKNVHSVLVTDFLVR